MEVVRYLEKIPPQSVVLHPNVPGGISLASNLAGKNSVISSLHTHVTDYIGIPEATTRFMLVDLFFNQDDMKVRSLVLNKYKVNYIYSPLKYAVTLNRQPELHEVLTNNEFVIYKVL